MDQLSHFGIIKIMNLAKFYQIVFKNHSFILKNLYFHQFKYLKDKVIFNLHNEL
jgi:hypothetical protein